MISCWYNSITLSNKPFQKQLEPDFNWAANQLLLALIWLSHCWIVFDDRLRRSRWGNHSQYPPLIPVLNNTGDIAVQVRKSCHSQSGWGTQASNRRMRKAGAGLVCPPSVTTSKQFIYQDVDGGVPSMFLPYRNQEDLPSVCHSHMPSVVVSYRVEAEDSRLALWLLSPGSDPHCQGHRGQR